VTGSDQGHTDRSGPRGRVPRWKRRPRLMIATVCAAILFLVLPSGLRLGTRFLIAFDAGAFVFLGAIWIMMMRATTSSMRRRARIEDEDRFVVLILSASVATAILLAIVVELHGIKDLPQVWIGIRIALAGATILASWIFINTMFALHYAHDYYADADDTGAKVAAGLVFPGHREPDYWDFLYFSFVIGMTFQVSDVQIDDHGLRRVALAHGVLAFFFNVVILALVINLLAGTI
jgi:uncharacterized membrane protein